MTTFDEQNPGYTIGEVIHVGSETLPKTAMHTLTVKETMGRDGEIRMGIKKLVVFGNTAPPLHRVFAFVIDPDKNIKDLPVAKEVIENPTATDVMKLLIKKRGGKPTTVSAEESRYINRLVHNF